ncbi:MAG: acetyltransferase [Phycisphaerae bacterium]|nr:acetyltransferase [Phycisphaerae bacterium]MDW8261254.1 acetyltransferase [Phycisphaerales bacterium]
MDVVIIGAGGHGRVVLEILQHHRKTRVVGFLDADESLSGKTVAGRKVLGHVNLLTKLKRSGVSGAIVAIGENRVRLEYMNRVIAAGMKLCNAVHPAAVVSRSARLGLNVVVAPGSVIGTEARIDDGVIVNTGAVVDHECEIGRAAHVCPAAALAGRVRVGEGALIGLGARVIQCLSIGPWATVGAGAVALEDVAENTVVAGVPARRLPDRQV